MFAVRSEANRIGKYTYVQCVWCIIEGLSDVRERLLSGNLYLHFYDGRARERAQYVS